MKKWGVVFFLLLVTQGCATSYVLHWRPQNFELMKRADTTKETSQIVEQNDLVMTYDRTPMVRVDSLLPDGSSWVYYNLNIKNLSKEKRKINLLALTLSYKTHRVPAVFEKTETVSNNYILDAKTKLTIPVKFKIPSELLNSYQKDEALKIELPLQKDNTLSMEVWLWHV